MSGTNFEKVAAKSKEVLKSALLKLQTREGQLKQACYKIAEKEEMIEELSKEVEDLGTETEGLKDENKDLSEKASEVVAEVVDEATNPATTLGVSEATKDAIIEAVSKVDIEAGDMIADAIDEAEGNSEVIDGEKLAAMTLDFVGLIAKKFSNQTTGRNDHIFSKSASSTKSSHENKMEAVLNKMANLR